jgi:hypothetical protein
MDAFGLEESPLVGEVIDYLLETVLDDPGENRREKLMHYAQEYLKGKEKDINKN